jgi:diguanylate cyclase (GGDEF)-like protein
VQNISLCASTKQQHDLVSFQFQITEQFPLVDAAPSVESLLGWSKEELLNPSCHWCELIHPKDRPILLSQIHSLTDSQSIQCDYQIKNKSGNYQWVRSQFIRLPYQPTIIATWFDLSQIKQSETHEIRYTQLLENIIEASHHLFYPAELEQGMNQVLAKIGTVTEVSRVYFLGLNTLPGSTALEQKIHKIPTASNYFAWGRKGSPKKPLGHWLKQSLGESDHNPIWQYLHQGHPLKGSIEQMPAEISTYLIQQQVHSILLIPILEHGHFSCVLGLENRHSRQNFTEREIQILEQLTITLGVALKQFHAESRLSHNAFHDPLTDLPNRALLLNRLNHCLRRKARQQTYTFAVLFLDLDRFKPVNDRLGHEVGDRLLIQVAQRLSSLIRPGDTVARLGGDEFVLLLEDVANATQAEAAINRLRTEITRLFKIDDHTIHIDASVGIALSSMEYTDAEEILQKADLAMYRAKHAGKGCHQIFEASMHSQMMLKSETESGMRLALQSNEIEVHYQPIISLDSGGIQGFEALARWNHPELGLLDPSHFIPIAEETGMIKILGMQVLQIACEQTRQWQDHIPNGSGLTIKVNISAKQLTQKDLFQQIKLILIETNFPPSHLHLELTESFIIQKDTATLSLIRQLQSLGIKIYLDDFGAGYSSLQYLNFFPIDGLKIDRMFTQKIPGSPETKAIVRSIIIMAQALKINIVVEGIENQQQIEYFRKFNSISGQGYLFSRPISAECIQELLLRQESLISEAYPA